MPKYRVIVTEEVEYSFEVEADNEENALSAAEIACTECDDLNKHFVAVTARDASDAELIDD